MEKIIPFSSKNFSNYDLKIKHLFREVGNFRPMSLSREVAWLIKGRFLRISRQYRELSIANLSLLTKISKKHIYSIENGLEIPSRSDWYTLTHKLNVELNADRLDWIIEETNNPKLIKARDDARNLQIRFGIYDPLRPNGKPRKNHSSTPSIVPFPKK